MGLKKDTKKPRTGYPVRGFFVSFSSGGCLVSRFLCFRRDRQAVTAGEVERHGTAQRPVKLDDGRRDKPVRMLDVQPCRAIVRDVRRYRLTHGTPIHTVATRSDGSITLTKNRSMLKDLQFYAGGIPLLQPVRVAADASADDEARVLA